MQSEPRFCSRRSPLICSNGVVATSQPLASEIGLRILKAGGNAADACVAAVAALNVTEPCMCGIGGDAFCLFYDAETRTVRGLNGSGAAPSALDLATARKTGGPGRKPVKGDAMLDPASPHCITVPGAAAAWCDVAAQFGTKPLAELLQPAIDLAEGGYPVNVVASKLWHNHASALDERWGGLANNPGAAAFLRPDGKPPKPGEWMRMPELAATFRELAANGADGFYTGRIAEEIVEIVRRHGGVMSSDDLASHASTLEQPITAPFGGHVVHQLPPNGHGLVTLLALRILEALPPLAPAKADAPQDVFPRSAESSHRIIEALKLAFADGAARVCEPKRPMMAADAAKRADSLQPIVTDAGRTRARAAAGRSGAAAACCCSRGTTCSCR